MEHTSEERLPDTEEKGPEFYEKDKGTAGIHGQIFEYKFCALSYLRATNKGYKFKLASNVKGFGAFDDVVVEYSDGNWSKRHIFLQLKSKMKQKDTRQQQMGGKGDLQLHSEVKQKITMQQLVGGKGDLQLQSKVKQKDTMQQQLGGKGDFSLRKYYDSYIQVEKNFNCSEEVVKMDGSIDESLFIIYTNADVAQELKSKKVIESGKEEFLMTGGSVLQFNEEEHPAIYQHLQDLPKHREFLSRFRIFYSQADEKEMDSHIKPELQQSMKLPESELDLTYTCYIDFVKDWWQNCNYFLKENNSEGTDLLRKTSERVRTSLVAKILDQRKSELDELNIIYKESTITYMKQLLEPNKSVLIFAPGPSTSLTAAKIHQMLSTTKHTILNLQQLIRYKSEVMLAWKSRFDVLVLESQKSTENLQGIFNEISTILNECGVEKRFIFIANTTGNIEQISALRRTFRTKLREEYDDWKLTDILTESRKFFLEKKVNFQGSVIQIKNLVKESDVQMFNALVCDTMSLLLANEKPAIGVPVANTLKYYIDRTLECKKYVKLGSQNESEVLNPIGGGTLEELQCINTYGEKNYKMSDYGQEDPHLSLANEEKETTKVCNETNEMLHLCKQDEQRPCEQNTDVLGSEHRNFQRNVPTIWRPNTLLDGEGRIILVTDEPGMGKSTLLTHLAKQTRQRHSDVWIVRVNINNYTSILHDIKANGFEEESAIRLITQAAQIKETDRVQLEKRLFNYICNSTGNMVVLIDGVDEVSPHYTEEVIQILRILSKTKIRKIWVTSQNSVKDQLEEEFQCQSYSLLPFSDEEQKSFLVKFWNQNYSNTNNDYIESLATRVVEISSKQLTDKEENFLGIPLQSLLLAEVFEEYLKHSSTSTTIDLPENINLFMLYKKYVKKKWDIYLTDKKNSDPTNVNAQIDDKALYDIFIENHKAAALMAILSTHHLEKLNDKNVLKKGKDFLQKIEQGLEKTGIITGIMEGRPVFLHRTLAEYFVADWLCDNKLESQIFMRDHLFESGFGVVRSMVDRILATKCPLHQAVLNSNSRHVAKLLTRKESITQKDRGGRTPLHIAISCRSPELIRLILEHGADVSSVDTFLGFSPVEYAVRMNDWEVLSLMMEKRPEIREQVLNEKNKACADPNVSALRAAAKYGHTDLLRYLIGKGNCVNMVLPGDSGTLLHEAARGNHIHTVRTLVDLGANCDIQDANGRTALHVSAEMGSVEVAKFIVERQEISSGEVEMKYIPTRDRPITKLNRLNVRDKDGNTPLHLAAAAGNTSTVRYLLSAGSDVRSCNTRGEYPLTLAARYGRNVTVELLLQSCCAVKCEEIMTSALRAAIVAGQVDMAALLLRSGAAVSVGEKEKPIHVASRMGHKEIVSLLLQYGACITSRTETENTALHLASEAGHLSLVKYLVELDRSGLYSLNYENETPLHLAARNGREYLVTYFAENGCNINAPSANGATCLHVACENGHYTTVECLLKHGAEVNAVNSADQTPLHIAASRGETEIVELLFQHNANFSLQDKDDITALLAASINGHQDTVLFIVQHGGNIEDTDGKGNTIAHFAVENENCDILKFLSEQEANLEVQNSDGDTPLLKAVREGRIRVVKCLAAKFSDINAQGIDGLRPLDVAVLKGDSEITRLLLERNARSGKTGLHIVVAARFGFLYLLQRFMAIGDDISVKGDNGESPLHAACESGHIATVQHLCEHGAVLDWQDNNGNTALHVAVSTGHLDVTRVLVESGANLCSSDTVGQTALHIAAKGGYLNIVQYLADRFAPIDRRNVKKETALLVAAAEGHEEIVRVLIEQGAGIGVRDIEGKTALDIATDKGYTDITQLLKDRAEGRKLVSFISHTELNAVSESGNVECLRRKLNAGATVDSATDRSDTDSSRMFKTTAEDTLRFQSNPRSALHTAAVNGNLEVVQRLVEAGIALDYGDPFGRTALCGAAKCGHKLIIRFLLQNGSCVNIPDCEGVRPADIAIREGHWGAVNEFLKHDPEITPKFTEYLTNQLHRTLDSGNLEDVWIILKCCISKNTTYKHGYTPLHVAAKSGYKEATSLLLNCGANVNEADNDGKTPLILAAENGHVEIVRELLSATAVTEISAPLLSAAKEGHTEVVRELLNHGASVNTKNNVGDTPLYIAGAKGRIDMVRVLLKHGANVNTADKDGRTSLYVAGENGHVEVVRELLKHGAHVNTADKDGETPLHIAGWTGNVEVVRELLDHGANVNTEDKDGRTSLYVACERGRMHVVQELMKHGVYVHYADSFGRISQYVAGWTGNVEVVRELLDHGANVNTANKCGRTPLYMAGENGHVEMVRELLKHGANVDTADKDGRTSLYVAGHKGHVEVVRELLNHGANVDTADKDGRTSLYKAGAKGHVEVVRQLLKHGASVNTADKGRWTPLYIAGQEGHVEVVRELLKHGANVNAEDERGRTSLYMAGDRWRVKVVRELLKHGANVNTADKDGRTSLYVAGRTGNVEVVRELLKHGANVNTADKDGRTSLYVAGENGHIHVVRELLNHGANVDTADKNFLTPLYVAGAKGHVEVVRELLEHGANVDTADKGGRTSLYVAGHNGHIEVVRELLEHGANVKTADENGVTPLYAARERGRVEVVRELLNHGANE